MQCHKVFYLCLGNMVCQAVYGRFRLPISVQWPSHLFGPCHAIRAVQWCGWDCIALLGGLGCGAVTMHGGHPKVDAGVCCALPRNEGSASNAVRSFVMASGLFTKGILDFAVFPGAEHCQRSVCAEHAAVHVQITDHAMRCYGATNS